MSGPVNIAIVGLGFGEDFLPVYLAHPEVGEVALVDPSVERLAAVGDRFGIEARYTDYAEMLTDERWHAVHVLAPVSFHADYAVAALEAGRHCACAVPMATEIEDLERVIAAEDRSGRNYMMMETAVHTREYRWVKELHSTGRIGTATLYRGFHVQNLDGYPEYWRGYPPMKYATHALAPLLDLTGDAVTRVVAHGSGLLTEERRGSFENPFPAEVGLFTLRDGDVVGEVTMSFFQTARSYVEGFDLYGDAGGVEWPQHEGDPLRLYELQPLADDLPETGLRGRRAIHSLVRPEDRPDGLPSELVPYLVDFEVPGPGGRGVEVRAAEHGGSHPWLVHEFVSSIVEGRPAAIDARRSAEFTAPGICAHTSALAGGTSVDVPQF